MAKTGGVAHEGEIEAWVEAAECGAISAGGDGDASVEEGFDDALDGGAGGEGAAGPVIVIDP